MHIFTKDNKNIADKTVTRMNSLRAIALAMSALLFLFCFSGCSGEEEASREADTNVFNLFMEAIRQRQYIEAYSFINDSIALDRGELSFSSKSSNALTTQEFAERYDEVYDILGITSMSYSIISDTRNGSKRTIEYTQVYESESLGSFDASGTATLVLENNAWKVSWSPALIFSEMGWDDTVAYSRLNAKRGDILAGNEIVAETVDLVTVYALLSEFTDKDTLYARIIELEDIYSEAENQLSAFSDWNELSESEKQGKISSLANELAAERLPSYMKDYSLFKQICADGIETTFTALNDAVGMDRETFDKKLEHVYGSDGSCTLAQYYPDEIDGDTLEKLDSITGIHVAMKNYGTARYYPYGTTLSHIIGYVSHADESDVEIFNTDRDPLDGLYTLDSIVGKSGIERKYETSLRGKDGYKYFIKGSDGRNIRTLCVKEKEDGLDVNLTIDLELQQYTEKLLDLVIYGEDFTGAVVVMNPVTGAVEAIASYPDYDLNSITRGESGYYSSLIEDSRTPLVNKAVNGSYPPGSTFKAFVAAAALDQNVVSADYVFTGEIINDYWTPTGYGRWIWPAIKRSRVFNRTQPTNMTNAMLHSDNIYFADLALKTGADRFLSYMSGIGMGERAPFELTTSKSQIIGANTAMNYKLLADSGYGQGEVLISPLQLAAMFCAFRNEGNIPTPYITDSIYRTEGIKHICVETVSPSVWIPNAISESTVNQIVPMLEGVMDPEKNGTGRKLRVPDCVIAGKTGTAELDAAKTRAISWFVGFRMGMENVEDERLVLVMFDVPYTDEYTSLKFDVARELLKLETFGDPNELFSGEE